jgi:hypothetical protein
MPIVALLVVIAIQASIAHGSHPTCRSGPISVSFETSSAARCIEYCGVRAKLPENSQVELSWDRCASDKFTVDGYGPFEIPEERDSFGTAHVRLK